ncbi:MAG: Primary amine oxidase precursor [Pelotomaculum sp. PtaB.Bin104]|uniref:Stalk domain-containing protein n=1 Tax=Pelotomaculum isophthalicicum JI TaxID=947010 RepID=A0A9X4JWD1_9FIRM|nr:stalk domain-containing protein [Pelotomaculum isophthalicicum]MDF9409896.1 stalk domain-containing protein [Pelotomaculum isophthalicicum JI]OPX91702.1 MAG: Primary amine oxidase precursor [Pelotomaculum sp. PtaB.Bin104]
MKRKAFFVFLLLAMFILISSASAQAETQLNMTGVWKFKFTSDSPALRVVLEQNGNEITGKMYKDNGTTATIKGNINEFEITLKAYEDDVAAYLESRGWAVPLQNLPKEGIYHLLKFPISANPNKFSGEGWYPIDSLDHTKVYNEKIHLGYAVLERVSSSQPTTPAPTPAVPTIPAIPSTPVVPVTPTIPTPALPTVPTVTSANPAPIYNVYNDYNTNTTNNTNVNSGNTTTTNNTNTYNINNNSNNTTTTNTNSGNITGSNVNSGNSTGNTTNTTMNNSGNTTTTNTSNMNSNNTTTTTTNNVSVLVNGRPLQMDVKPFVNEDGRTMVPLRAIGEALGATVNWDDATSTVTFVKEGRSVSLTIGSNTASIDGKTVELDTRPVIKDNRTMVPARFISESLGAKVGWDDKTQTVNIDQ